MRGQEPRCLNLAGSIPAVLASSLSSSAEQLASGRAADVAPLKDRPLALQPPAYIACSIAAQIW